MFYAVAMMLPESCGTVDNCGFREDEKQSGKMENCIDFTPV
ncbi:hypothetical protein [Clostridium sp. HBUAS56010]|nr:hypothetical protein [Clostridium sp. HBUAS56010]